MSKTNTAVYTITHPWVQTMVLAAQTKIAPDIEVRFVDDRDETAVAQWYPRADFLVTLRLSPERVRLLERCKLVMCNGVGYDAIDVAGLQAAGIPFAVSPQRTAVGVAEHALMLMLALSRQLVPANEALMNGRFPMFDMREGSRNLFGQTLGIVGLGRIGRRVAQLGRALGMRVLFHDIVAPPEELVADWGITAVLLEQLIAKAEIITLHVPLTPLTERLFGAAQFAQMQPDALFINTSRGGTYDLDALYEALASGHLRGAGLDVFSPEPPPIDHPILQLPNVLATPHMASGTVDRHRAIAEGQMANCLRVLREERPKNEVALL